MEKQTFEIPNGCSKVTVEQIGNTIVTSFENDKYVPKVGDCVRVNFVIWIGFVHVKKILDNKVHCYVILDYDGLIQKDDWYDSEYEATQITTEELQSEFNKLGYEYDFETHEATKIKWKPKVGDCYFYVDCNLDIVPTINKNSENDLELFKIGNYYNSEFDAAKRRQHYLSFKD